MPATYAFLERLLRSSGGKVCSGLVCVQKCTLFPLSPCFWNAEVSTRGECRPLWNNRVLLTPPPPPPHPYHPSPRLPVYPQPLPLPSFPDPLGDPLLRCVALLAVMCSIALVKKSVFSHPPPFVVVCFWFIFVSLCLHHSGVQGSD